MEHITVNTFFNKTIVFFILAYGAIAFPHSVFASTVFVDTNHSDFFVGDTIQFTVRVNSENKEINAIEGTILLEYSADAVALADLNTAGSPFTLWPDKPLPSEDTRSISFVGGSPGGFTSADATVLNITLKLQKPGEITVSPNNIAVYLNDGKGTKDLVNTNALHINVFPKTSETPSTDDWSAIMSSDRTAPEPFDIILGRDPYLFHNQYFISFFTTDTESGVAYYEVQEGAHAFVRAESPYVVADQSLQSAITVKAVDKAGNEREVTFTPRTISRTSALLWIAAISLLVFAIMFRVWRKNVRRAT